ncbi:MAG: hypothetical protein IT445_10200 [Phycisphaeraceae bacterium]|nr:hypothetical protein [Phycisphaeraceae bacterium]
MMFTRMRLLTVTLALLAGRSLPADELPDFGLMFNNDADLSFTDNDPQRSAANLRAEIDGLAGTPVRTLMFCAGTDVLYYPTKVSSVWGWRETSYTQYHEQPRNEDEMWYQRIEKIRKGIEAGIDPIRVAGEEARKLGMYFVPSCRMNDDHFIFDPFNYPLTGEFWLKHHEQYTIKDSPILSDEHYGNLLDFSHQEVRDFRRDVLFEMIDRYQDIMDGLELDFNRSQILFPRGKGPERAHLVTDLVRQVRQRLNEVGEKNGKRYYLFVRVPPTLKNCTWAGMDIAAWMKDRLVNVLIPAQLMTLSHDMPIDEFVALAAPAGAAVYPAIYPRTTYQWPIPRVPTQDHYTEPATREVTPELVCGAAANYWHMGARGFQLFNFQHEDMAVRPYTDRVYRILRDLARPQSLILADKVYAVTPGYYLDHEDTYQYRKQVPATFNGSDLVELTMIVGENYSDRTSLAYPDAVVLRVGFSHLAEDAGMTVRLNGENLFEGPLSPQLIRPATAAPVSSAAMAAEVYLQIPIDHPTMLKQGRNLLSFELRSASDDPAKPTAIAECAVAVFYERQYLKMLFE